MEITVFCLIVFLAFHCNCQKTTENRVSSTNVQVLQEMFDILQKQIKEGNIERTKLEKKIDRIENTIANVTSELTSSKVEVEKIKLPPDENKGRQCHCKGSNNSQNYPQPVDFIGFSANGAENSSGILVFPYALTNHGRHYDVATGKFTCPITGLYFFSFQLLADQNFVSAYIDINDRWSFIFARCQPGASSKRNMMCGNSGIMKCQVGDVVWVEITNGQLATNNRANSFVGFLLYAL